MLLEQTPEQLVADLVLLLDMEPRGASRFEGRCHPGSTGRLYGGQVIAQALAAAERTVPEDRAAHSMHAYFLRRGSAESPVTFMVMNDFDGRSYSNRRVVASQRGEAILNLTASFHIREDGRMHHQFPAIPDVPPPEEIMPLYLKGRKFAQDTGLHMPDVFSQPDAIEMRMVEEPMWGTREPCPPVMHTWMRTAASLPDDPRVHRAILAYASDRQLLGASTRPHGDSILQGNVMAASLDHSIWFHAPFRADEWFLYAMESPWAGDGRGFCRGRVYNRDGCLVASTSQEGAIRQLRSR